MSHTVLVCDDAIFMRTMISDILAQAGFEIGSGMAINTVAPEEAAQELRDALERARPAATG